MSTRRDRERRRGGRELSPSRPVFVGLGANLGDPEATLRQAIAALASGAALRQVRASRLRRTAPVGPVPQPAFVNAVLAAETDWEPEPLLTWLHAVEASFGRRRDHEVRWGPRPLDLDLLLVGDLVMDTPSITLPHRELAHRRFVLEPLAELAPDLRHPVLHRTIAELLEALP